MSLIISHFSGQTHSNLDFCGDTCGLAWKASLCLLCLFFLAPFPEGPKLALKSDGRVCEGECEGRRGTVMGIKCPENSPTFAWVGGSTRAPFASPFPPLTVSALQHRGTVLLSYYDVYCEKSVIATVLGFWKKGIGLKN